MCSVVMPSGAKKISGMNAVTPTGLASVAHQMAIHSPSAAVRQAASLKPPCGPISNMATVTAGPR